MFTPKTSTSTIPSFVKEKVTFLMQKDSLRTYSISNRLFHYNRYGFVYLYKGKFVECCMFPKRKTLTELTDYINTMVYSRIGAPAKKELRRGVKGYICK